MTSTILAAAVIATAPIDEARFLHSVALVESGNNPAAVNGNARGAYQMKPPARLDAARQLAAEGHPYPASASDPVLASAYLRKLRRYLEQRGIKNPSPETLALCWNQGAGGAARVGYAPNDYARRVANLYRASTRRN